MKRAKEIWLKVDVVGRTSGGGGGGPGRATMTLGYQMFRTAVGGGEVQGLGLLGRGAAMGMVMFLITFAFTILYLRVGFYRRGGRA